MTDQMQEAAQQTGMLPQEFQPQPIPLAWSIGSHPSGFVVITIFDATGQRVIILTHEDADRFAHELQGAVPTARSGLIIP